MAEMFPERCVFFCESPPSLNKLVLRLDPPSRPITAQLAHQLACDSCAAFALDDATVIAVFEGDKQPGFSSSFRMNELETNITADSDDNEITGLLLREAVRRALVCSLIKQGWILLEENILVFGDYLHEGSLLETISLDVQLHSTGHTALLVAPDLTCFHLAKPLERLPGALRKRFDEGRSIQVEDYSWRCEEGCSFECCVLPSMKHCFVLEICKNVSSSEMELSKRVWIHENGIHLPAEYYYIKVCFSTETADASYWFPSCLVLEKSGLFPALPSLRCSKLLHVVEHFVADAKACKNFNLGTIKAFSSNNASLAPWTTAASLKSSSSEFKFPSAIENSSLSDLQPETLEKSLRAKPTTAGLTKEPFTSTQTPAMAPSTESKQKVLLAPKFDRRKPQVEKKNNSKPASEVKPSKENKKSSSQVNSEKSSLKEEALKATIQQKPASKPEAALEQNKIITQESSKRKCDQTLQSSDSIASLVTTKHAEGKLKDLSVADLKNFLRMKKAKLSGKKEELIQRIQDLL